MHSYYHDRVHIKICRLTKKKLSPFQQIITKDLQHEINQIKNKVKYLKNEVLNLKTNDLTLEAKLALLQTPLQPTEIPPSIPIKISHIAETEIPTQ